MRMSPESPLQRMPMNLDLDTFAPLHYTHAHDVKIQLYAHLHEFRINLADK